MTNPLTIHLTTENEETIDAMMDTCQMRVSGIKYGDTTAQRYPFMWLSVMKDDSFHPGIHILLTETHSRLPIAYTNDTDSVLLRVGQENRQLRHLLVSVEHRIRMALPEEQRCNLQPLLRQPDTPGYDDTISVKTKYTSIDESASSGTLEKGNMLTKCVLRVQRLNMYQGKIYASLQLVACCVDVNTSDSIACTPQASDEDYFRMMAGVPAH